MTVKQTEKLIESKGEKDRVGEREIVRIPRRSQKELSCTPSAVDWTGVESTGLDDDDDGTWELCSGDYR